MIKKIIGTLIVIGLIITGVSIFMYMQSFHTLSISLADDVSEVSISKDEKAIKTLSETGAVSLQDGTYTLTPKGEKVDTATISVTIKGKDATVAVDPDYSKEYLGSVLESEISQIQQVITAAYPTVLENFEFGNGQLYEKGEWFSASLTQIVENSNDSSDVYRFILKKVGDGWSFTVTPRLVISQSDAEDTPAHIVNTTNLFTGVKGAYRNTRQTIDNDYFNPQGE